MTRDALPAPGEGLLLTQFITVRDVAASRRSYAGILGGEVVLEGTRRSRRSPTGGSS